MRTVVLSDPAVIAELNESFTSLQINLTDEGFPAELNGLSSWQEAYQRDQRYSLGLATSIVLDPGGSAPYGSSGCGHLGEINTSINYDPVRFLGYLKDSRQRYLRARRALDLKDQDTLEAVRSETTAQLHEVNRCSCPVRKEVFPSEAVETLEK